MSAVEKDVVPVYVYSLSSLLEYVSKIQKKGDDELLMFRGARQDYGAKEFAPSLYRSDVKKECVIYRECQRFNNEEFHEDRTAFDKLSRMQHYDAPTRVLDLSEDLWSSVYFSLGGTEKTKNAVLYVLEIDKDKVRYYDSDAVSVIANLAKIPLENKENQKSKKAILDDLLRIKKENPGVCHLRIFNDCQSAKFLLHEIKEEKPYFEPIIDPDHIVSIQFVWPKLTSNRLKRQKGAFLLFGLNKCDIEKQIPIFKGVSNDLSIDKSHSHPIKKIHKIIMVSGALPEMRMELETMGIKTPFIYPEMDRVSKYLMDKYKK